MSGLGFTKGHRPGGGLPRWLGGKDSTCKSWNAGSIPGWGRFPGGRNSNPLQYSCLENPMDRGAWRPRVKVKVTQSCLTLCDSMGYSPWNSPGQNTGVGSLSLLQGSSQPREDITEHTPKEETGREASILWEHQVVIQVPGKGRGDKRKTQKEGTQTNTVWFYSYDVLTIVKLIGSESTLIDARGRGLWSNENESKAEKEGWRWGLSLGHLQTQATGAPGGSVVRSPLSNAGDMGLIPGPRGSHMPRSSN